MSDDLIMSENVRGWIFILIVLGAVPFIGDYFWMIFFCCYGFWTLIGLVLPRWSYTEEREVLWGSLILLIILIPSCHSFNKYERAQKIKESEVSAGDNLNTLVSKKNYGDRWPYTIPYGVLDCKKVKSKHYATITYDGTTYAINGSARSSGKYSPLESIWKDNPEHPGSKIPDPGIIKKALSICEQKFVSPKSKQHKVCRADTNWHKVTGTLHSKNARYWLDASCPNRIITAGDEFIVLAKARKPEILDDLGSNFLSGVKDYSEQMQDCITFKAPHNMNRKVSTLARECFEEEF